MLLNAPNTSSFTLKNYVSALATLIVSCFRSDAHRDAMTPERDRKVQASRNVRNKNNKELN